PTVSHLIPKHLPHGLNGPPVLPWTRPRSTQRERHTRTLNMTPMHQMHAPYYTRSVSHSPRVTWCSLPHYPHPHRPDTSGCTGSRPYALFSIPFSIPPS
ncbi:hypothetical protein PAXRUDRAFT_836111, partial [Paxillus rubicundulus Ve08.2h10]